MRHFLFLLTFICGVCHAQEKAKKHTCRILFLERPSGAPTTLHLFDGRSSQEVDLPGLNLSPVYDLPAGPLTVSLLPAALSDPKNLPVGAPSATIPETMTDFYLLLLSDPANKVVPVRMQVVNASAEKLMKGHTLWFNLTDLLIGGKLGSETLLIKPKGSVVMGPPRNNEGDYPVSLAYRKAGVDALYPICETRWVFDPRSRNIGFIISNEGIRTPRVMVFPDFRSTPEKHEEKTPQP